MKLSMHDFYYKIFKLENRGKWYELLEPYIIEVDIQNRMTLIGDKDSTDEFDSYWMSLTPEELDPQFQWKFNIGDIVTDDVDIMKIVALPVLDPRSESTFNPLQIDEYGNRYFIMRLNKDGENKEAGDPIAYLHQKYNINQIRLATQEDIDRIFSKE